MPSELIQEGIPIAEQIPGKITFTTQREEIFFIFNEDIPMIAETFRQQMRKAGHDNTVIDIHLLHFGVDFKQGTGCIFLQYFLSSTDKQYALALFWQFDPKSNKIQHIFLSPLFDQFGIYVGLEKIDLGIKNERLLKELKKVESLCRGITISPEIETSADLQNMLYRVAGIGVKKISIEMEPLKTFEPGKHVTEQLPGEFILTIQPKDVLTFLFEDYAPVGVAFNKRIEEADLIEDETTGPIMQIGIDTEQGIGCILLQYGLLEGDQNVLIALFWQYDPESYEIQRVTMSPFIDEFGTPICLEVINLDMRQKDLLTALYKIRALYLISKTIPQDEAT